MPRHLGVAYGQQLSQWHAKLNGCNSECSAADLENIFFKKKRKKTSRDVQTETGRYEDYKCLRSSVNLHNQRQACPVNSNRLCVHLCQRVFTSVGTKTLSNLEEGDEDRQRKRERAEEGRDWCQGPRASLS